MAVQKKEQLFLPKEPLDLPREPLELESEYHDHPSGHHQHQEHYANDVRTLLSWHAPGRPFRKKQKEYFLNMLVIMLAIEVILFLFAQYMLMLLVVSIVFVSYALNTVPPHNFHYKISSEGITIEDHYFLWQELYDFYFKRVDGMDVLKIRTQAYFPGELTITLGDVHMEQVKSVLLPFLPYREYVKPTFTEKAGDWLSRTFPLDAAS